MEENTIGNCSLDCNSNRPSGGIHSNSIHGFAAVETQGIQFGELLHTYEHRHCKRKRLGLLDSYFVAVLKRTVSFSALGCCDSTGQWDALYIPVLADQATVQPYLVLSSVLQSLKSPPHGLISTAQFTIST